VAIKLSNNAFSLLAADITNNATSLTVTSGDGDLFPVLGANDYFYCTLLDVDNNMEIVQVTARTGNLFTIIRAREDTTAKSFNAGSRVELRVTAQSVLDAVTTNLTSVTLVSFGVTATASELNVLDGITSTTAELNLLDGAIITTSELNILDGVTASANDINKLVGLNATTAELNKLSGVTATPSDINKLSGLTASTAELNKLAGATLTTAELNKLTGVTATTAEINKLAGVTVTTAEINRLAGVTSNIQTQINSFATFPAGSVISFAGATAPVGWLLCDGAAVSRTTYATLFTAIGTTYGAGNGSTTFNLPDMRGRVAAGKDDMGGTAANRLTGTSGGVDGLTLGSAGGLETHALTTAQMPLHGHPWFSTYTTQTTFQSKSTGGFPHSTNSTGVRPAYTGTPSGAQGQQIGGAGGNQAHNNVQPTLVMNSIIKT